MRSLYIFISLFILSFCHVSLYACTGIYYSDDNIILAGSNLDWFDPVAKIWYIPSQEDKYGVIYFGTNGAPQYGTNAKGLFFQRKINSYVKVSRSTHKPFYEGSLFHKIMQECASIEEVIEVLNQYNLKELERAKIFFGDLNGNSMIAEGDNIIKKQGKYQISRALLCQSQMNQPGYQYNIYKKAESMIKGKTASIDHFRKTLQKVCAQKQNPTVCSSVFDLKNGNIYLYYFHDFQNVYTINFKEALKKGQRTIEVHELFPDNKRANEYRAMITEKMESWKSTRQIVDIDTNVYKDYIGKYRTFLGGVPQIISITTGEDKLYYSTSEFGKGELLPTSSKTFFFVYVDGVWDVKFTENSVITKSKNYSYTAYRMQL